MAAMRGVLLRAGGAPLRQLRNSPALMAGSRRAFSVPALSPLLTRSLEEQDPEIFDIIEQEKRRLRDSLNLIPSENFASPAVLQALGSVMQNKYSEGYPGARYYAGNEWIDAAEQACQRRALEAFRLDPEQWGVNVQSLSGSPANFEVYTALLNPHDRLMALDLPHGGHLSHGYQTPSRKISAVSKYFESLPYRLDEKTGLINYDEVDMLAARYRPKLLISGASAYSRHIDTGRLKQSADSIDALFMFDMAHISGLVAADVVPSPFEHADIVTTTTHKSLRGPRGAMIFFRKGVRKVTKQGKEIMYDLEGPINASVFPGHQGGPHNHTITALAVALKQAQSPEFKDYQSQVLKNCAAMADRLAELGYALVSGGTSNHLLLVDVRPQDVHGGQVERVLELANITVNKNTVPGDLSAMKPGGVRIGSPALTSREMKEKDFVQIANFLDRGVKLTQKIVQQATQTPQEGGKNMASTIGDFRKFATYERFPELKQLQEEVTAFVRQFPVIGYKESEMRYKD